MGQIKILLRRTYQEACQDILPVFSGKFDLISNKIIYVSVIISA